MVQLHHPVNPVPAWALEVRQLQIHKGGNTILTDFSWLHQPGEVAWVVGENGAGKSSLLRILAGRDRPQAGSVHYIGPDETRPDPIYYHPDMNLPGQMTVGDWQRFLARIAPTLDHYPLDPALLPAAVPPGRGVQKLSTGEAKRIILAALLSRDAPFVILDEPFEHLSREGKDILARHLVERARRRVVIVATNQEIPPGAGGPELHYSSDRLLLTRGAEV